MSSSAEPFIGLAMSGGGARAMAFHLGCLRALHDLELLPKVRVLSTVSGGSVIGAMYAYSDAEFPAFEKSVRGVLKAGIDRAIISRILLTPTGLQIVRDWCKRVLSTIWDKLNQIGRRERLTPSHAPANFITVTSVLAAVLDEIFGGKKLAAVGRTGLETIINCTDVGSGTAFRFGSKTSGGWRRGVTSNASSISVGAAVAASAAHPLFLPPLFLTLRLWLKGGESTADIPLGDGGIYDNLGVAPLLPKRDAEHSVHVHNLQHLIVLDAGPGQWPISIPSIGPLSRMRNAVDAMHRRSQAQSYATLHQLREQGALSNFLMIYMGQIDERLPVLPPDLVRRDEVRDYPTDFSPMTDEQISLLSKRGEQLTRILFTRYWSADELN